MLDCLSTSGMSGAPIFVVHNGVAKIAALVSGRMTWANSSRTEMIALAVERPLRQVMNDARSVRQLARDQLPRWAARSKAQRSVQPVAERKVVKANGKRLPVVNRLNSVSGGGRKIVRPPKASQ